MKEEDEIEAVDFMRGQKRRDKELQQVYTPHRHQVDDDEEGEYGMAFWITMSIVVWLVVVGAVVIISLGAWR